MSHVSRTRRHTVWPSLITIAKRTQALAWSWVAVVRFFGRGSVKRLRDDGKGARDRTEEAMEDRNCPQIACRLPRVWTPLKPNSLPTTVPLKVKRPRSGAPVANRCVDKDTAAQIHKQ